jgi:hypothetical protein
MEDPFRTALYAAVVPALVAAALLFALRHLRRGEVRPADAGLAAGAAFVAGFLGLVGTPKRFPPLEHWQWLVYVGPLAAAVGLLDVRRTPAPSWLRWLLRSALIVFSIRAVAPDSAVMPMALVAFVTALVIIALDAVAKRAEPASALSVALLLALGTGVSVALSGFADAGLVCGSLAAGLGTCLLLSRFVRVSARDVPVVSGVLCAVTAVTGVVLAEMTWPMAALLAAGPVAAAIVEMTLAPRLKALPAAAARIGVAFAFTAGAVALAAILR